MKKTFIVCLLVLVIAICAIIIKINSNNKNSDLKKITVAEVTHSIFYAPWYVAIENKYFEDEGIKIDLILTPGADKVAAAVLSGDAQVGFCGPEATIYVYNGGEKDYIQTFAGLTKRDGQIIVSRKKIDNFTWDMLKGKEVLAGRTGVLTHLLLHNYSGLNL